jgi:hypothetical protein
MTRLHIACSGGGNREAEEEKQRMWEAQQEILRKRREGRALEGVKERRASAKKKVCLNLLRAILDSIRSREGPQRTIQARHKARHSILTITTRCCALNGAIFKRSTRSVWIPHTDADASACCVIPIRMQAQEKEDKKERDRAALARGERPEDYDEPYEPYGKEDAGMQKGIIIPLAPFGIPKFDQGERFDLKVRCLLDKATFCEIATA